MPLTIQWMALEALCFRVVRPFVRACVCVPAEAFSERLAFTASMRVLTCLRHGEQVSTVANGRDGIVLWTELDDYCDKLQRSSVGARMYCQNSQPTTVQFITLWAYTFSELS